MGRGAHGERVLVLRVLAVGAPGKVNPILARQIFKICGAAPFSNIIG